MRPPTCDVCGGHVAGDDGGLVRFASRPSDLDWHRRAESGGLVGHPPDTGWFCRAHIEPARALSTSTYPEAIAELAPPTPTPPDDRDVQIEPAPLADLEAASLRRHGLTEYRMAPTYFAGQGAAIVVPIKRIALQELVDVLVAALPPLAAALDVPAPPPLRQTNHRSWSPMDGSVVPNCPFSDEVRRIAQVGAYEFVVNSDVSYWNEDTASNGGCHASISYRPDVEVAPPGRANPWSVRMSAGSHDAIGPIVYVDTITIWQPMPDAYVAVLADMVAILR